MVWFTDRDIFYFYFSIMTLICIVCLYYITNDILISNNILFAKVGGRRR